MGKICTNQNGRLFYYFYWNGRKIREGTGLPDTRENKKKLEAHLKTITAEIEAGMFNEERYLFHFPYGNLTREFGKKIGRAVPKDITFRLYAENWLKENAPPVLKKSTYQDYTSTLNKHLYPAFGGSPISEITESDLKIFRQGLRGLSAKRANNIFVPLKTIFKEAHRKGVIKGDPTEFIKPLKTGKTDIHPLSVQEINFLTDKMPSFWSKFLTVACYTGMRTGELLALKWKDIDLEHGLIHVRSSITRGEEGLPKTAASQRDISMLPPVREAILGLMVDYCLMDPGRWSIYVFPNKVGKPHNADGIRNRMWLPALKNARLEQRTLYQTRHTCASLMLKAGEDITWVARQMGTSVEMLSKTYARYVQTPTRTDGSAFMNMLGQSLSIVGAK